jgi:hypothetical protein
MDEKAEETGHGPRYHVIHHGDNGGIQTQAFRTKRELTKYLKPYRPDSIIAMFRGTKLHATITNNYEII